MAWTCQRRLWERKPLSSIYYLSICHLSLSSIYLASLFPSIHPPTYHLSFCHLLWSNTSGAYLLPHPTHTLSYPSPWPPGKSTECISIVKALRRIAVKIQLTKACLFLSYPIFPELNWKQTFVYFFLHRLSSDSRAPWITSWDRLSFTLSDGIPTITCFLHCLGELLKLQWLPQTEYLLCARHVMLTITLDITTYEIPNLTDKKRES